MTVRYIRLPELLNDLVIVRGEGTYKRIIKTYQKVNLLILDEWLLKPLTIDQAMDLFEIIEVRTRQGAMIFALNLIQEAGMIVLEQLKTVQCQKQLLIVSSIILMKSLLMEKNPCGNATA